MNEKFEPGVSFAQVDCASEASLCEELLTAETAAESSRDLMVFSRDALDARLYPRELPSSSSSLSQWIRSTPTTPQQEGQQDTATTTAGGGGVWEGHKGCVGPFGEGVKRVCVFHAEWCPACQQFRMEWNKIVTTSQQEQNNNNNNNNIQWHHTDVDEDPMSAARFEVESLPTVLVVTEEGKVVTYDGEMDATSVVTWVSSDMKGKGTALPPPVEEDDSKQEKDQDDSKGWEVVQGDKGGETASDANADQLLQTTPGGPGVLAYVYAQWCPHCKNMAPQWAKAVQEAKEKGIATRFVKVDGDEAPLTAARLGADGFPTVVFIKDGILHDYAGERTAADMLKVASQQDGWKSFVTEKGPLPAAPTKVDSGEEEEEQQHGEEIWAKLKDTDVTALNDKTFDQEVTKAADTTWLIDFYATWCPHCQQLAPAFGEAATKSKSTGVRFGKVDTDNAQDVSARYNIEGLPTLLLVRGNKYLEYGGKRTAAAIAEFVAKPHGDSEPWKTLGSAAAATESKGNPTPIDKAVIQLTENNFEKETRGHTFIIDAYAEWCPHCQKFGPIFGRAAKRAKEDGLPVKFGMLDTDHCPNLSDRFNIESLPTVFVLNPDGTSSKYEGSRTDESLVSEARKLSAGINNKKPAAAKAESPKVITLTENEFDLRFQPGQKWLISFHASWCGHCQQFAPTFSKLAAQFSKSHPHVTVAKVDTDAEKELIQLFNVTELPTILRIDENGKVFKYSGSRDEKSVTAFLNGEAVYSVEQGQAPRPEKDLPLPEGVIRATDETIADLAATGKLVIVMEHRRCPECVRMRAKLTEMAEAIAQNPESNVRLAVVDVRANPGVGAALNLNGGLYPVVVLTQDGQKFWTLPADTYTGMDLLSMVEDGLDEKEAKKLGFVKPEVLKSAAGGDEDEFGGTKAGGESVLPGVEQDEARKQRQRREEEQAQKKKNEKPAMPIAVLNESNFEEIIKAKQPWAVLFYDAEDMQWEPIWKKIWKATAKNVGPEYRFGLVSSLDEGELADRFNITLGFQLVVLRDGMTWTAPEISGEAEDVVVALSDFLRTGYLEAPGTYGLPKAPAKGTGSSSVVELTGGDFVSRTAKGVWLVMFYGPSCMTCKKIEGVFGQLAEHVAINRHARLAQLHVAKFDVENEINLRVAANEHIEYQPTIKVRTGGNSFTFTGDNTFEALLAFLDVGWREKEIKLRPKARDMPKAKRDEELEARLEREEKEANEAKKRQPKGASEKSDSQMKRIQALVTSIKQQLPVIGILIGAIVVIIAWVVISSRRMERERNQRREAAKEAAKNAMLKKSPKPKPVEQVKQLPKKEEKKD